MGAVLPSFARRRTIALATGAGAARQHFSVSALQSAEDHHKTPVTEDAAFYDTTVERYASQPVEMLSLMQMLQFGRNAATQPEKILKSARYVQREIPKRLARRLLDLQLLPYIVVNNPHIKRVYTHYRRSFDVLRQLPPVHTLEDNATFSQIMRQQLHQHAPMLDALATGLREVKSKQLIGRCLQLDAFFDSMLRSRISRRVIAEQHLQLTERRPGYIGIISTDLDVADAVDLAAQKTRQVCMETYGAAPEIILSGDIAARISYIPAHLDYMLYELLKNAARAVVEQHASAHATQHSGTALPHAWHGSAGAAPTPPQQQHLHAHHAPLDHHHHVHHHHLGATAAAAARGGVGHHGLRPAGALPPIHVRICQGYSAGSDLTIKISDQGGGIPTQILDRVWSYGFTTVGGIPPGYDLALVPPLHHHHHAAPPLQGFATAPPPGRHWPGSASDAAPLAYEPQHAQHTVGALELGLAASGGRAGVFPSAEAAARATHSHWHAYSPAGVASGPYAPQALTHLHVGGVAAAAGGSLSPDGVYHREGLGSEGMVALMVEGPDGAAGPGGGSGGGGGRFRIAGLGFGLPLSRLYARYFGGDLTLQPIPGYGTDAYLTIRRLEDGQWREHINNEGAVLMGQGDS